jgi:2-methylcitrate dehydratase PrpD
MNAPRPQPRNTETVDAARTMGRYAATLPYEALPPRLVEITKQCVLDTIGTTLAATTLAPEAPLFHDYVREVGGREECTLMGYGEKAPAQLAAFLNGANSHMLDYDDVGVGHVSVATIPVAFAMADKLGGVSGRELLTAVAAGIDIHTRLFPYDTTEEWDLNQQFSQTQSIGYLSGAAVASRLARLTEEQVYNAWGLAYQQVSGPHQRHLGMHAGWSGQGAVLATLLAQRGIPGVKDVLDGKHGLFRTHLRNVEPDYQRLTGELGTRFRTLELHGFKAWPACGLTRRPVNAILDLRREHGIAPEQVESIVVLGGEHILRLAEPLEYRRRPPHSAQAKFSIPFTVAVAMTHGDVRLRNYTPDALKDPRVLAMADRVWVEKDARANRPKEAASVQIRLRDGKVHQKEVLYPLGDDRRNPLSQLQIEEKFRDCASFSLKPIPKTDVDAVIGLVANLENVSDVTEITNFL